MNMEALHFRESNYPVSFVTLTSSFSPAVWRPFFLILEYMASGARWSLYPVGMKIKLNTFSSDINGWNERNVLMTLTRQQTWEL